jgi:hypothetical protein
MQIHICCRMGDLWQFRTTSSPNPSPRPIPWPIWYRCAAWPAPGNPTRASISARRKKGLSGACSASISGWSRSIDSQANGPQLLYGLRYHIHVNTPEEAITFHDQVGYWLWEPATGLIMQSIAIPRGQVVLAGGTAKPGDKQISVEARRGDTRFGICSTTFLEEAFRTDYYRIDITFHDDDSWSYVTRTDLAVRGGVPAFDHRDTNRLRRVAPPKPNPLFTLSQDLAR